jgi:hypothetical protein
MGTPELGLEEGRRRARVGGAAVTLCELGWERSGRACARSAAAAVLPHWLPARPWFTRAKPPGGLSGPHLEWRPMPPRCSRSSCSRSRSQSARSWRRRRSTPLFWLSCASMATLILFYCECGSSRPGLTVNRAGQGVATSARWKRTLPLSRLRFRRTQYIETMKFREFGAPVPRRQAAAGSSCPPTVSVLCTAGVTQEAPTPKTIAHQTLTEKPNDRIHRGTLQDRPESWMPRITRSALVRLAGH